MSGGYGGECVGLPTLPEEWPIMACAIEGKGRGCIAKRDIYSGEVVAVEAPLTAVPSLEEGQTHTFCGRCFAAIPGEAVDEHPCRGCGMIRHCSAECHAAAQVELHTAPICAAMSELKAATSAATPAATQDELEGALLLIQLHCLRDGTAQPYASNAHHVTRPSGPDAVREILALCHSAAHVASEVTQQHHRAAAFYRGVSSLRGHFDEPMCRELLLRDMQNGLHMSCPADGGGVEIRGSCLLGHISMLNHACYPNAARIDYIDMKGCEALGDLPSLCTMVRAIQPIPEGSEVCISYAPVGCQSDERKEHLADTYGITCSCERCRLEDEMQAAEDAEECEEGEEGVDSCAKGGGCGHAGHVHAMDDLEAALDAECGAAEEEEGMCGGAEHAGHGEEGEGMGDDGEVPPMAIYNVFVMRYICPQEDCTGTLVPIRDTIDGTRRCAVGDIPGEVRSGMECNTCYKLQTEEEFERRMQADDECDD